MLIWGSYVDVLIAALFYLITASYEDAWTRVHEKTGVIALQLPPPKTRSLTPEKHPLVKKRPPVALRNRSLLQPTD